MPHNMSTSTYPNFLVAGVAKAGTTSLYEYLVQHPDVYVPDIKESFFFTSDIYRNLPDADPHAAAIRKRTIYTFDDYLALFSNGAAAGAIGEVGTFYTYHHATTIPLIRERLGDVSILIMLRNPVDRAYSAYCHFRGYELETLSFEDALSAEAARIQDNWYTMWHYRQAGLYHDQVKAFTEAFSRVKVCFSEDFRQDAEGVMRDVYAFLGVDNSFKPDVSVNFMVSGQPRSSTLDKLVAPPAGVKRLLRPVVQRIIPEQWRHRFRSKVRMANMVKPVMHPETRAGLVEFYRDDVAKLGDMVGRDLGHWVT